MSDIKIGAGHDDSKRKVQINPPRERTGLKVGVGDSFDRAELDAGINVQDGPLPAAQAPTAASARKGSPHRESHHESDASRTLYVRALLLIVGGLAMAFSYLIIARDLPVTLVPLVIVASVAALYLFALFLAPPGSGVKSFGKVIGALIEAAFPKKT